MIEDKIRMQFSLSELDDFKLVERYVVDWIGESIKIAPEAMSESPEMLEDLISAAINQANEKASVEMQAKMKQITGGISIPGLNF